MAFMSEIGLDGIKKFGTAKEFTAWLCLAPNNKISGGKVLSHHLPKGSNRLKVSLRPSANVIGNLKECHLNDFFRRINYKKGRATAVSATARIKRSESRTPMKINIVSKTRCNNLEYAISQCTI